MSIDDDHAAVIRGRAKHEFTCDIVIVCDDRTREAAFTEFGEFNGFIDRVVRQHCADGAESLDGVYGFRGQRLLAMQQRWHEERAFLAIGIDDVEVVRTAEDDLGLFGQILDSCSHLITLALAGQRSHVDILDARVTDADLAEAGCKCADDITGDRTGCDDPPYRRALLSGLRDNLVRDFLDVEIKLLGSGHGVGPEYRHIE